MVGHSNGDVNFWELRRTAWEVVKAVKGTNAFLMSNLLYLALLLKSPIKFVPWDIFPCLTNAQHKYQQSLDVQWQISYSYPDQLCLQLTVAMIEKACPRPAPASVYTLMHSTPAWQS